MERFCLSDCSDSDLSVTHIGCAAILPSRSVYRLGGMFRSEMPFGKIHTPMDIDNNNTAVGIETHGIANTLCMNSN